MSRPTKLIINCTTKEQIEVELTDDEIAQFEADRIKTQTELANIETQNIAKAQAKAELLDRLGLTAEEVKLLLS